MIGKFEEFKEWEKQELSHVREELAAINQKLDVLREFRWKVLGAASVISLVASTFVSGVVKLLLK